VPRPAEAQVLRKSIGFGERNYLRRPLALGRRVPPRPVHDGFDEEHVGQNERVIHLAGQHDRLAGAGERAIRPAERHKVQRRVANSAWA